MGKIEVCLEVNNSNNIDLLRDNITLTGNVMWYGAKGQMRIRGEAEEALANIVHLLNNEALEIVKEIAPNFCKEQRINLKD